MININLPKKIRFFFVGGLGALIEVSLFELFVNIKLNIHISNFIAFNIAFFACYLMHYNYTYIKPYKSERKKLEGFIKYSILMYTQYLIGTYLLLIMINYFEFNTLISKIMQIAIVTPIGYIFQKKIFISKN